MEGDDRPVWDLPLDEEEIGASFAETPSHRCHRVLSPGNERALADRSRNLCPVWCGRPVHNDVATEGMG